MPQPSERCLSRKARIVRCCPKRNVYIIQRSCRICGGSFGYVTPIKTDIQYHQISAQIFSIPATCSRCIQML
ncbi:MAG: hypothetical protein ACLUZX_12485 [Subdoligranulum sp.]